MLSFEIRAPTGNLVESSSKQSISSVPTFDVAFLVAINNMMV
ncbi:hypothetical protein HanRHA438_Chr06g0249531 [Helianthus annuus]|uniref:Uncharacterized protein n=1 Tax=Helianthus annuus TaxID=4232 RepID=A0A9K3NIC0_HELAN|nr:hypothetical protein HanXRQr2_Chr06g0240401 [Helianthus annuus]KAJ0683049.1 hypothetical protein HanPI659440_Chr16g0654081 [Helianthus annuus]KAJ0910184.1 hypothetical protein HanRHA438_Chr06g0249531 [Helianthus annuus]